jgi:hypothetical protein
MLGLPWNLQGRPEPLQVETPIGTTLAGKAQLTLENFKGQPDLGVPAPPLTAPDPGGPLGPAVNQDLVTPALACIRQVAIKAAGRRRNGQGTTPREILR